MPVAQTTEGLEINIVTGTSSISHVNWKSFL